MHIQNMWNGMKSTGENKLKSEKTPLVSVIIPAYNYGRYISETIESVLAQTYPNIELIVIDDGSTDNTRDIVKKYSKVKYVYQKNAGVANAMNHGVLISKGKFFICLGADDKLHPTYVSRCVNEILKEKRIGFIWTAAQAFGQTEVIGHRDILSPRVLHNRFSIYRDPGGQTGAALIRREAFDEVGGFDESLPAYEDWDLVIRIYKKWKGKPIFEPLHFYRFHDNQRTSRTRKAPLHRYLEDKHPFMKIYIPLVRIFDFSVLWFKHPKVGMIRLWNKIVPHFFNYEELSEPSDM
jgi:glycosyltransferase involved in cell wall biosynthesis